MIQEIIKALSVVAGLTCIFVALKTKPHRDEKDIL